MSRRRLLQQSPSGDDDDADGDLEMPLSDRGAEVKIPVAYTDLQALCPGSDIRPLLCLPDAGDEDEGVSRIKASAVPPLLGLKPLSTRNQQSRKD
ncbi:hypothetical protein CVT26_010517 [Gymnopilus dilepis]|uniref:Uncharacterized protein n=1 Tax=Gymnopilus dilepis TaxID=231916 RepID=A0A409Y0I8_9AGAR|nr:hypothetical protein CVT26_010517 [Gymnopilus dilepis]